MNPMKIASLICLPLVVVGVGAACAHGDVLYQSQGNSNNEFTSYDGLGCTVQTADPFLVNGVSQGSYLDAFYYPMALLNTPADASLLGNQELWVGFLMRRDANNAWAGGVFLSSATTLDGARYGPGYAGAIGWHKQNASITLISADYARNASFSLTPVPEQQVAVMARFYETEGSGTFNTADLYVDGNLADGIDFGSPLGTGFDIGSGAQSTIKNLRLGANVGEVRSYDNLIVASSQGEAYAAMGAVPEPSQYAMMAGLGLVGFGVWRRKTKSSK